MRIVDIMSFIVIMPFIILIVLGYLLFGIRVINGPVYFTNSKDQAFQDAVESYFAANEDNHLLKTYTISVSGEESNSLQFCSQDKYLYTFPQLKSFVYQSSKRYIYDKQTNQITSYTLDSQRCLLARD